MHGEFTGRGECLLLAITLLSSLATLMIGRRVRAPASVAAYAAAVAVLVADPLLSSATMHRVDRVVGMAGAGLLLADVAFMVSNSNFGSQDVSSVGSSL